MRISASTYIFSNERLNSGHLETIKRAGFDEIDLFALPGHFDWYDQGHVDEIHRGLRESGLRCGCIHAPWDPGLTIDIASLDDTQRSNSLAEVKACIDVLRRFGGDVLVAHPGSDVTSRARYEERVARARDSLSEIAAYTRGKRIKLAIENPPPGELCHEQDEILALLGSFQETPNVGFCFDTGHANTNPGGMDLITQVPLPCYIVHLSDNHGENDDHLPPGQGSIDWLRFFLKLDELRFDGICTLELGPCFDAENVLGEMKDWIARMQQ
jgi:sugar phosphate isomerase/epimerase